MSRYSHPIAGKIKKIYVTQGDNLFNSDGIRCDKRVALNIDGKIYWLNYNFAKISDLDYVLSQFGVAITGKDWYPICYDENNKFIPATPKSFSRIQHHHDDIFNPKYRYLRNSVPVPNTETMTLFWDVNVLRNHLAQ